MFEGFRIGRQHVTTLPPAVNKLCDGEPVACEHKCSFYEPLCSTVEGLSQWIFFINGWSHQVVTVVNQFSFHGILPPHYGSTALL